MYFSFLSHQYFRDDRSTLNQIRRNVNYIMWYDMPARFYQLTCREMNLKDQALTNMRSTLRRKSHLRRTTETRPCRSKGTDLNPWPSTIVIFGGNSHLARLLVAGIRSDLRRAPACSLSLGGVESGVDKEACSRQTSHALGEVDCRFATLIFKLDTT